MQAVQSLQGLWIFDAEAGQEQGKLHLIDDQIQMVGHISEHKLSLKVRICCQLHKNTLANPCKPLGSPITKTGDRLGASFRSRQTNDSYQFQITGRIKILSIQPVLSTAHRHCPVHLLLPNLPTSSYIPLDHHPLTTKIHQATLSSSSSSLLAATTSAALSSESTARCSASSGGGTAAEPPSCSRSCTDGVTGSPGGAKWRYGVRWRWRRKAEKL